MKPAVMFLRRGGKFWWHVWRVYDSDWGASLPRRWAPWLFGMMIGAKGGRVR